MKVLKVAAVAMLLAAAGCAGNVSRVTCPALVDWPAAFQTQLAGELETHSATEMPAFHELALRAERQRLAVKGCK